MVMAIRADLFKDAYEIMLARRDRIVVDNKEKRKKNAAACGGPCVAFDRCQDKVSGECVAGKGRKGLPAISGRACYI